MQVLNGDIDQALIEMDDLIHEASNKAESKTTLAALYAVKASALSKQEKFEAALTNVDNSLQLIYELFGENNGFAADVLQAKANILFDLNQYSESEALYKKVIGICEAAPNSFTDILAATRAAYGNLLAHTDRFAEAMTAYEKALDALHYENVETVHEVSYFSELLDVMKGRGSACLKEYRHTGTRDLITAPIFDEAINLIELVRSIYIHEGSKQKLIEGNYLIFEHALQSKFIILEDSFGVETIQGLFDIFEKSKVQTLLDQLRYAEGMASDKLPKNLAQTIDSLKQTLVISRQELFVARHLSDSVFRQRNRDYLQHKENYESFVYRLREAHPEYYQFIYNQEVVPLERLQQSILNEKTTLIEYFLGESHLYAIYVSQQEIKYSMTPLPDDFHELISSGLEAIMQGRLDEKVKKTFQETILNDLYKNIPNETDQLIIVPDGELMYIPFEMLPGEEVEYLIEKYIISYASSATLLAYQQELSPEAERSFAGFAPSYGNDVAVSIDTATDIEVAALVRRGNMELAATIEEVQSIAELLKGDLYVKQKATETAFKSQAGKYDILHLAMHALVNTTNPSYSRLLFDLSSSEGIEDGQLHVEELYGMELNARLAVLSACNTGFGNIKKGEGSLSIARAFTYAGVPSTLMSLWEVPDRSTAEIMVNFYKELADGKTKDMALRQAKLNYLADPSISVDLKKPLYWAGFIATGDMSQMGGATNLWYYYLALCVSLGLILLWWWLRKKNTGA